MWEHIIFVFIRIKRGCLTVFSDSWQDSEVSSLPLSGWSFELSDKEERPQCRDGPCLTLVWAVLFWAAHQLQVPSRVYFLEQRSCFILLCFVSQKKKGRKMYQECRNSFTWILKTEIFRSLNGRRKEQGGHLQHHACFRLSNERPPGTLAYSTEYRRMVSMATPG